jgi:hypothetical protein
VDCDGLVAHFWVYGVESEGGVARRGFISGSQERREGRKGL